MDTVWSFCQVVFEWILAFYGWGVGGPMHYALFGIVVGAFSAVAFYYLDRPDEPTESIRTFLIGGVFWPLMLPLLALVGIVISIWFSGVLLLEKVLLRAEKKA